MEELDNKDILVDQDNEHGRIEWYGRLAGEQREKFAELLDKRAANGLNLE